MKAIIAAGGRGARLYPLTYSNNKHLIPIANKPLVLYPLESVVEVGIKEIGIIYRNNLDEIKNVLGNGSKWGVKLTYIQQKEPLGLARVIKISKEFIKGDKFIYHLGDNIFVNGIKKPFEYFVSGKFNALATIIHHKENARMGVPYFDKKGNLIKYVEKPKNPPHDFAIPGLYFFDSSVFKCFEGKSAIKPSERGEYEISAPYQWLIDHKYVVKTIEYEGIWKDPGKFNDLVETNMVLLNFKKDFVNKGKVDKRSHVSGDIEIGKNSKIEGSTLRGPLSIDEGVLIKNSYIGPYTSIGKSCKLINCHIENSVLMDGVTIENVEGRIDASLIGRNSQITSVNEKPVSHSFMLGDHTKVIL